MSFNLVQSKKINISLIGTYEYKSENIKENHFIIIDTLNGKFIGKYYGTEDGSGHGVFFYENEMKNLNLEHDRISFGIEKRDLFQTTRLRILKQKSKSKLENSVGISKTVLNYGGKITTEGFELNCESKYGDCWEKEMKFVKVKNKNIR